MTSMVIVAVLCAAALHAGWNTAIKSKADKLVSSAQVCFGAAIVGLPQLLFLPLPFVESYIYVLLSGLVHAVYFTALWLAYRDSHFSVAYPLIRGLVPVITTIGALLFVGEEMTMYSLAGVLVISTGILGLGMDGLRKGGINRRGILFVVINAFAIASYSVLDGVGARLSGNPLSYNVWVGIASALLFLPVVLLNRKANLMRDLIDGRWFALSSGAMALAGYGIVIWAMTKAPIGMVSALRETSVIFAALFAAKILKERFGKSRFFASLFVASGILLMHAR